MDVNNNSTSASITASVSVTPKFSHSFLVALLLLSILPLIAGFSFLWFEKEHSWVPFSIFFCLFAVAVWGWSKSQKSIDMGNALPTTLTDKSGAQICTDSRMLELPHVIENLGNLFQSMGVREPLPEPDGLVSKDGEILPNSQSEAAQVAQNINEEIKAQSDDFIQKVIRGGPEIAQDKQQLPEEVFKEVLEHNKVNLKK